MPNENWTEDFELEARRMEAGENGCLASHYCEDCGLHLSECDCEPDLRGQDGE